MMSTLTSATSELYSQWFYLTSAEQLFYKTASDGYF